jgi:hypothetical protein
MISAKPLDQMAWYTRLQRGDKGVLPTVLNAMLIFANDPALKDLLAYNAFRSEHLITRAPPAVEDGGATLLGPYPRAPGGLRTSRSRKAISSVCGRQGSRAGLWKTPCWPKRR